MSLNKPRKRQKETIVIELKSICGKSREDKYWRNEQEDRYRHLVNQDISGSHSGAADFSSFLHCYAVLTGK